MSLRRDIEAEMFFIKRKRRWVTKVLVSLFPKSFIEFTDKHLARSQETNEINNDQFHSLKHYIEEDCYGRIIKARKKEPDNWEE